MLPLADEVLRCKRHVPGSLYSILQENTSVRKLLEDRGRIGSSLQSSCHQEKPCQGWDNTECLFLLPYRIVTFSLGVRLVREENPSIVACFHS
jgi:hypothetical protein